MFVCIFVHVCVYVYLNIFPRLIRYKNLEQIIILIHVSLVAKYNLSETWGLLIKGEVAKLLTYGVHDEFSTLAIILEIREQMKI